MQTEALKKISIWRNCALAVSALGIFLAYRGFSVRNDIVMGIAGAVLMIISIIIAGTINRGLQNGRRNVQRILDAAEKQKEQS